MIIVISLDEACIITDNLGLTLIYRGLPFNNMRLIHMFWIWRIHLLHMIRMWWDLYRIKVKDEEDIIYYEFCESIQGLIHCRPIFTLTSPGCAWSIHCFCCSYAAKSSSVNIPSSSNGCEYNSNMFFVWSPLKCNIIYFSLDVYYTYIPLLIIVKVFLSSGINELLHTDLSIFVLIHLTEHVFSHTVHVLVSLHHIILWISIFVHFVQLKCNTKSNTD